jgi:2-iminobutanoate/2-iminopropanoate deaminase
MSKGTQVTSVAVSSKAAPAAIGPYSPAVITEPFVYVSGQLSIDPATGDLEGVTAAEQAGRSISNLEALLAEAGLGLEHVVKTTVFMTDLAEFAAVNEVYASRFNGPVPPARSAVQVAALPRGARIEIEAIARRPLS